MTDRTSQIIRKYVMLAVMFALPGPIVFLFTGSVWFLVIYNSFNFALNMTAMIAAIDALKAASPLTDMVRQYTKLPPAEPSFWERLKRRFRKA